MNDFFLVGVSGGSDSMALLDILFKQGKKLVVAHVNYKSRLSSDRDEEIVRKYCDKNGIKLYTTTASEYNKKDGNFENWARIKRYTFFKEIYEKNQCKALFIGHNLDDFIETYMLQAHRKIKCDYFGIKRENYLYGMNVIRPLLDKEKKELENYCKEQEIEYGEDETNQDLSYKRNEFRNKIVSKMSKEDKFKLLKEIENKNIALQIEYNRIEKILEDCIENEKINLSKFNKLEDDDKKSLLYKFLMRKFAVKLSIGDKRLADVLKKIESSKPNILLWKKENIYFCKEYNYLSFYEESESYSYQISLDKIECEIPVASISRNGDLKDLLQVCKDDFPIIIQNADQNNRKVNRLFIENKIPLMQRKKWPLVLNKNGELLLVLGLEISYNKKVPFCKEMENIYIKRKKE